MTTPATAPNAPVEPTEPQSVAARRLTLAACAVVIVGLTLWFRYRAVGISSLFLDDAWVGVGAHFATIGDTIGSGLTSPGFSLLYRGWSTVFGTGATTAQLLALAFAVAAPLVLFFAATERKLPWYAALLGGALLATAPAHIDMSTRLKQYTAEAFAATVVLWVAWRVIDRLESRRRWAVFVAVAIGASLLSSVGAVIAGTALGACIFATLVTRPLRLRNAVLATGAFGVVAGLWLLFAVRPNVHSKLTDYWRGYYLDGNGFAGGLPTRLKVVAEGFQSINSTLVLLVLLIAAVIVLVRRPLVGVLLLSPTAVAILLAAFAVAPMGTGRTDVYLFPGYAFLIAVAVAEVAVLLRGRTQWATTVVTATAVAGFAFVAIAASPSPTDTKPCPDPPLRGSTLLRCPYPPEDLTPLVHLVEQRRRPGDQIVVYSSSDWAYGIATKYPIEKVADSKSATDWVVKVNGPNITVLEPHRDDPERFGPELDRLTAKGKRIWLIGSHLFSDWPELQYMLMQRGFVQGETTLRDGAALVYFDPPAPKQ